MPGKLIILVYARQINIILAGESSREKLDRSVGRFEKENET